MSLPTLLLSFPSLIPHPANSHQPTRLFIFTSSLTASVLQPTSVLSPTITLKWNPSLSVGILKLRISKKTSCQFASAFESANRRLASLPSQPWRLRSALLFPPPHLVLAIRDIGMEPTIYMYPIQSSLLRHDNARWPATAALEYLRTSDRESNAFSPSFPLSQHSSA